MHTKEKTKGNKVTINATGVCGNIHGESSFSSDNLQNTKTCKKVHDTDYKYKVNAEKGYGLLQWTTSDRKKA